MLATVINSLALSSALEKIGQKAQVFTAINMFPIGEYYSKWRAIEAMQNGTVAIISGGTGNPFFTTDTGSALRGIEIEAEVMLKGTRVDGIYTADPEKDPTAKKFDKISYDEIYTRGLKVMDLTATTLWYIKPGLIWLFLKKRVHLFTKLIIQKNFNLIHYGRRKDILELCRRKNGYGHRILR